MRNDDDPDVEEGRASIIHTKFEDCHYRLREQRRVKVKLFVSLWI